MSRQFRWVVLTAGVVAWTSGDSLAQGPPTRNRVPPTRSRKPTTAPTPEQQTAQRLVELLLKMANEQAPLSPSAKKPTAPVRSPRWTTDYEIEPVKRTITPINTKPVPLGASSPILLAYQLAVEAEQADAIRDHLERREIVLIDESLVVSVETRHRGLAYVRPTEGPHKGKLFVVENKFVK